MDGFPAVTHPGWSHRHPWLVQGTTTRGDADRPFDLGLFAEASPAGAVLAAWEHLRGASGCARVVHAHQVHGAAVRLHGPGASGLQVAEACDGHATDVPGTLLAVTVADCVPVSLVAPAARAVALLHAGWRGVVAGMLEEGIDVLHGRWGVKPTGLEVHFGPSICGSCYEVGGEVFEGLGLPVPDTPAPVDLRAALAHRALDAGVPAEGITVSSHCTLCGDAGFFSHRGGDGARQVGYLGLRG